MSYPQTVLEEYICIYERKTEKKKGRRKERKIKKDGRERRKKEGKEREGDKKGGRENWSNTECKEYAV